MGAMAHHLRVLLMALLVALTAPATAETWPTRPLRALVPLSAGSAVDLIARVVFAQVERQLGQPVIIENRTGAGGIIAMRAVAAPSLTATHFLLRQRSSPVRPGPCRSSSLILSKISLRSFRSPTRRMFSLWRPAAAYTRSTISCLMRAPSAVQ